jgi:ABC-type glycerol-3-phosphate transport system substrate-binding protein
MTKTIRSLLFVFVLASLVLAACGGAATEAPGGARHRSSRNLRSTQSLPRLR